MTKKRTLDSTQVAKITLMTDLAIKVPVSVGRLFKNYRVVKRVH